MFASVFVTMCGDMPKSEHEASRTAENASLIEAAIASPEIIETLKSQGFTSEELSGYLALRRFTNIFRKEGIKKSRAEILDLLARDFYNQQRITGVAWIQDCKSEEDLIAIMDRDSKLPEPKETPVYMETIVRQYL